MAMFHVVECDGCGKRRELKGSGWEPDEAESWRQVNVRTISGSILPEVMLCSDCTVTITGPGGVKRIEKVPD